MSSNLLKSSWFAVRNDEKRVIDSNGRMEKKLNEIKKNMQTQVEQEDAYNEEESQSGLDQEQMEALLGDNTAEEMAELQPEMTESSIIKAEPVQQGPTPEELIAQAEEQINAMMEQAKNDAEAMKQQAYEAGHQEGYQAGQQEAEKLVEQQRAEYQQKKEQLEQYYQGKIEELEPQFINVLTGIYEHIFHVDLSKFRGIIEYSISQILGTADGSKDFIIHISQQDYPFISEKKEQIREMATANATVEIIEDITLAQGECLIETGGGIFDCGIDTQLSGLRKELQLLSYEKKEDKETVNA